MKYKCFKIGMPRLGLPPKILLVMKLTTLILLTLIVQVSASTYAQKLTLQKDNISLKEIFGEIKKQTSYNVVWKSDQLKNTRSIDVSFNNEDVTKVLDHVLSGLKLGYTITDKTIVIKKIEGSILDKVSDFFRQDSLIFMGFILDEKDKPMPGASIKNKETNLIARSAATGAFAVRASNKATLVISYVGYITREITLAGLNPKEELKITLTPGQNELGQVDVVSTGYYQLPKERATGSFEVITKEMLQHSSDPNLIKRLDGITTSMDFRNDLNFVNSANTQIASTAPSKSPIANLTIRGKNTLNSNQTGFNNTSGAVLVVIDGVPSPYPIDNVNPDNVESLTILKDAASASIWGSRAANGVIVVTTKRGSFDQPIAVNFNNNFSIQEKPDLFYTKLMSTSDFIDAQAFQFQMSNSNVAPPTINKFPTFLSPVAEIMNQKARGEISPEAAAAKLDALRGNDIRNDYDKYLFRNAITQRYSLGISGGNKKVTWNLFGGYDKNRGNSIGADDNKINLNYNASFKPFKNLSMNAGVTYTVRNTENQDTNPGYVTAVIGTPYYLYTRLADDQGNSVSIPYKYRPAFLQLLSTAYGSLIQDLTFAPLNNIKEGYRKTTYKNLNFNAGANYKINNILSANLNYNYAIEDNIIKQLSRKNSFYVRDLVTFYTSPGIPASSGVLASPKGTQAVPNNSILLTQPQSIHNQALQGSINLDKGWDDKHQLNAIAGINVTQGDFFSSQNKYYGYDEKTLAINNQLNYKDQQPTLFANGFFATAYIPFTVPNFTKIRTRTVSMYANAAYTYNQRYTISGSIRKDMTSDFGVGYNKSGTPFYSLGGKWNIDAEDFYKISWLPMLSLRTTFGYNGNSNPSVFPFAQIARSTGGQENDLPYAIVTSGYTNNQLRPEKTGVLNLGLDFGITNGRISGSFDLYNKRTTDLIATNAVDFSTSFSRLQYNTASLNTYGTDFNLNTINVKSGLFTWRSGFLFSYNRVKVTKLFTPVAKTAGDGTLGTPAYNLGADLQRIYGFRWAGLDPVTGNPLGYDANGQPIVINNSSFNTINNLPLATARYFGSAVPVYYGSFRNTIQYGQLSISANIQYKLGYYFRRPQNTLVQYSNLLSSNVPVGAEYARRWQKPGDEVLTNVPAQFYPANNLSDLFYQLADINVQKGDHVRLQEVNFSYAFGKKSWFVKNPRVYFNMPVNVILWRANKLGLDPNTADYPIPRTYSFGFSANF